MQLERIMQSFGFTFTCVLSVCGRGEECSKRRSSCIWWWFQIHQL